MEKLVLKAVARKPGKKGASRKLRAAGSIPVVCYGSHMDSISASINPADLTRVLGTAYGANLVFDLVVDDNGNEIRREVMLKSVQRDPLTRRVIHVDIYAVDADRKVMVRVPLRFDGKAVGVGLGGKLRSAARDVVVACLPKDIPTEIVVDVTPMNLRDRIQISAVPRPAGCEFVYGTDFLVAEIIPPRS